MAIPWLKCRIGRQYQQISLREVTNLETDTLGFIWMSSAANLYRFNGADLELKFKFDSEKIISLTKKDGIFYLGTEVGRILTVNPYNAKSEGDLRK